MTVSCDSITFEHGSFHRMQCNEEDLERGKKRQDNKRNWFQGYGRWRLTLQEFNKRELRGKKQLA